ncbi:hypothetical protein EYF80_057109 [Liparis tanakae]|uniref:Uncharacterized protein n=1 Tax=Liparis tanakae TaxID=230148 RepID=A0A4Z2EV96_9TELE|nr:hypothetical protein EYF80_057109 [Liparis tanakae]
MAEARFLLRNRTPVSLTTNILILGFGMNDRASSSTTKLDRNFGELLEMARATFPYAQIRLPFFNIYPTLTQREVTNLRYLTLIKGTPNPISALDTGLFATTRDEVHWTPDTARSMWAHWRNSMEVRPAAGTNPKGESVINLSATFCLDSVQQGLLERGLSFIPTVGESAKQQEELAMQLKAYHRRLKLHALFGNSRGDRKTPTLSVGIGLGTQVLEEHYEEIIVETKEGLRRMAGVDHQQAWEVAIKWMGKK